MKKMVCRTKYGALSSSWYRDSSLHSVPFRMTDTRHAELVSASLTDENNYGILRQTQILKQVQDDKTYPLSVMSYEL